MCVWVCACVGVHVSTELGGRLPRGMDRLAAHARHSRWSADTLRETHGFLKIVSRLSAGLDKRESHGEWLNLKSSSIPKKLPFGLDKSRPRD